MSPLVVRRYRADRLLREEFERLRERVIGGVSGRLLAAGVRLDSSDLGACYSQAWQGLYAAVLDGEEIGNPAAWLALVTYRRAIDEHRSRRTIALAPCAASRAPDHGAGPAALAPDERPDERRDIVADLDDRARLRQLFEALRARLSVREQQAATLCYLHGLSRADAAARMGISQSRMRKLMEGRGAGSQGVAAKMGALVQTIRAGEWCEQQGSLMRAFAYGVLDPRGERYQLALMHRDACPACRAYVLSLRGLAAALPPAPALLHWALGAGSGTLAGAGAGAGAGAAGGGSGAGPVGAGFGGGAVSASSAAGVGAAGGGWWLAGPLGAKLAVGCLFALGVGAGCVALDQHGGAPRTPTHRHHFAGNAVARTSRAVLGAVAGAGLTGPGSVAAEGAAGAPTLPAHAPVAASAQASREFGPEQSASRSASVSALRAGPTASAAAAAARPLPTVASSATGNLAPGARAPGRSSSPAGVSAAQREFSPG